jgi:TrmH family RNA methyltransferase
MLSRSLFAKISALKFNIGKINEKYFLAEGWRIIQEAIKSGWQINYIVIEGDYLDKYKETFSNLSPNTEIYTVNRKEMRELSGLESPSGILGVLSRKEIGFKGGDFIIIADGIQDPGNLGTIIRVADAAGASGVIALKGTVDPYSYKVVRASMGSIFHISVIKEKDTENLFSTFKSRYHIIGTSSHSGYVYNKFDWKFPLALVLGNEGRGISKEIEEFCEANVRVPILGKAESLNVAIAFGIIAYEIVMGKK